MLRRPVSFSELFLQSAVSPALDLSNKMKDKNPLEDSHKHCQTRSFRGEESRYTLEIFVSLFGGGSLLSLCFIV